jgi:multidrug resistance efflux pump
MNDLRFERDFASSDIQGTPQRRKGNRPNGHPAILRVSAIIVAGLLALLMVTAVVPPIVADQSDRAVIDAPVALLTAPISGEIASIAATPGLDVGAGDRLAQISNPRLDRSTLIALEEKEAEAREKFDATRANRKSDLAYVASLDTEINSQTEQLRMQLQSQIEELGAQVAQSTAISGETKALVDRQTRMVSENTASTDMLKPTEQRYLATRHNIDAQNAKQKQKQAQLQALNNGIYVGDDMVAINVLVQKRRDIDLDAQRMEIDEKQQSAMLNDLQRLIDAEHKRLASLTAASVVSDGKGKVMAVGAQTGRHVSAGDTIASVVDCDQSFVVAIFSYRQGENLKPGTRVKVDGASFKSGVVNAVLPKTSDKMDERYAVPFPQTERRELYVIIGPDQANANTSSASNTTVAPHACMVGQWVTVTRDNGIVPSMSVTWREVGNLLASSWTGRRESQPLGAAAMPDAEIRQTGLVKLQHEFRRHLALNSKSQ